MNGACSKIDGQCAFLEISGLVDGVITDDSDSFVFGARHVYRNIFDNRKNVELYDATEIERQLGIRMQCFPLLALLLGSDYTDGVQLSISRLIFS